MTWLRRDVHLVPELREPNRDRLDMYRAAELTRHMLVDRDV